MFFTVMWNDVILWCYKPGYPYKPVPMTYLILNSIQKLILIITNKGVPKEGGQMGRTPQISIKKFPRSFRSSN